MILYDAREHGRRSALGTPWRFVGDTVMGGVSRGGISLEVVDGEAGLVLEGEVSLDNGGGFIQANFDLHPPGRGEGEGEFVGAFDAREFAGFRARLRGDGAPLALLVKTTDLYRPWQSYRAELCLPAQWTDVTILFSELHPHRTEAAFDPGGIRRVALAALGRRGESGRPPGRVSVALGRLALATDPGATS